jgi:competence protein ComGB
MTRQRRWRRMEQVRFLESMAQMLDVGYDFAQALDTMAVLMPRIRTDLVDIGLGLAQGERLPSLLRPHLRPQIVGAFELVEVHGQLRQLMAELGGREQQLHRQTQKLKSLLIYPAVLFVMVCIIAGLMGHFLLPQLASMGTVIPVDFSTVMAIAGGGATIAGGIGFWTWWRVKRLSLWQRVVRLQKIPVVAQLSRHLIGYYLSLHLGLLLASGVSLATIVRRSQEVGTGMVGEFSEIANTHLREGGDLLSLVASLKVLPGECQLLLSKGKPQADVGRDFLTLSTQEFLKFEQLINRLIMMVQPLCFCVIGCLVIGLYMMMLVPMYSNMGDLMTW